MDLDFVGVSLSAVHGELAGVLDSGLLDEGGEVGEPEVVLGLVGEQGVTDLEDGAGLPRN